MLLFAWILWTLLAALLGGALVSWIRKEREIVAPLGLCLVTLGVFVLPRAAYLLWFHRAPLTSGGLPLEAQQGLLASTLALGLAATGALLLGHRCESARHIGASIRFSLPESDPTRALYLSLVYGAVGCGALLLLFRALGSVSYALAHQFQVARQLQGRSILFQLTRVLLVPVGLLAIDRSGARFRPWVWGLAAANAIALAPFGHRSLILGALAYPVLLYHLAWRPIALRYLAIGAVVVGTATFSFSYLRLLGAKRLEQAASVFVRQPRMAVHFAFNAAGEFKILDATTIVVRDVPDFMPMNYGETFWRVPWMIVPRKLWGDRKPVTLGEIIVQKYLPQIGAGYPPMAIGEFYAAGGPFAVVLGFFMLGWLGRAVWEWRLRHRSVGDASVYLAACYFFADFTRVGDPSRTTWFFLLGLGFLTVAFAIAAPRTPTLQGLQSELA